MNPYDQSAVIPYRFVEGQLQVLLITSRKKKRWVIPKGIVEPDLSPPKSAAKEALEEAGVYGHVSNDVLGIYSYQKWGGTCVVKVFPLNVTEILDDWLENFRDRQWLSPVDAAELVREPELKQILQQFPVYINSQN